MIDTFQHPPKIEKAVSEINKLAKQFVPPTNPITKARWLEIVRSNYPHLEKAAIIGMSVVCQLLIEDVMNPFAIVYIDVPSSGKTIVLNFFSSLPCSYTTDNFSPKAFVSHAANKTLEDLEKIDMLPQLKNKLLLIRELATLFGKRDDDLLECMGILTRVLDGEGYESNSGVHGKRGYNEKILFMILGASTPIRPKIWKVMGNFGSRLLFFQLKSPQKTEDELVAQLHTNWKDKELACKKATEDLFACLQQEHQEKIHWNRDKDNLEAQQIISRCAKLLSKLRGTVNVWQEKDSEGKEYQHTQPIIEQPDRLNQLLYNLACGHAVLCGRSYVLIEDIEVVLNVTFDSADYHRSKLFRFLIAKNGQVSSNEVMECLRSSKPTALSYLKTLELLEIVSTEGFAGEITTASLHPELSWFASKQCKDLLNTQTTQTTSEPEPPHIEEVTVEGTSLRSENVLEYFKQGY